MRWRSRLAGWLVVALPVVFLGYFFVYPLVRILLTGLAPDGSFDPIPFQRLFTSRSLLGIAWFTLWQATASTLLTLLVALPGAYVLARYTFPGKALFRALITVPFVLPTVVVGAAFLALLGPGGVLGVDLRRTVWAILIAHVFYNYAVVARTVGAFWERLDPRHEEAARVLGASRWTTFSKVTLPLLWPAIASAASIVFLFTFTSFGVILILGGFRIATIEVEIWRRTTELLDLGTASVLALAQLVGVATVLTAYGRSQERRAAAQSLVAASRSVRPTSVRERAMVGGILAASAVFLGVPPAILIERSLRTAEGYGFSFYRSLGRSTRGDALFVTPAESIANSLGFAIVATLLALAVGLAAAWIVARRRGALGRTFDTLLMLPLGTSAVTIGFGFLVALDEPVDLRTSIWLIPIAHAVVAVPFVVRSAVPLLRSIRPRLREAAAVLGASPGRVWREIDLPIVGRALAIAAGFAFAISLGEFGATAFIARADYPTLPIAIFRLLSRPGELNFGRAMALSTVLMILTAASIMAIERFRRSEVGDF